ncbi:MAG: hypothetical protein ACRDOO_19550, partial [Actinomadura sp.]
MEAEPPGPPPVTPRTGLISRSPRLLAAAIAVAATVTLLIVIGLIRFISAPGPARAADPTTSAPAADRQAVDAVLAGRARAVRDRDRTAFLATVASAPPAFQAEQERLFDNLTALPFAGWRQELASPEPIAAGPGGSTLRVILRYRLRGFDQGEVTRTQYLSFAARPGTGWVIVGDGAAQGLRDDPEIWDGGRLTVLRGRHSLVIGNRPADAGRDDTLREIARRLDAAVPVVTGVVGTAWDRGAVALVPADQRQAAELIGGDQNLGRVAALATT